MSSKTGKTPVIESAEWRRLLAYEADLVASLAIATGAQGNSTALVDTPETVAKALLEYYKLGATSLLIRGYDPRSDAIQ